LTIPLAKIPPILLAAVARGSKDSAEALRDMHFQLTDLLHRAHIYPVSLSSDGTETERRLQRLVVDTAHCVYKYTIPNTTTGCTINLDIPLFHGYPSIMVQDSKHGLKTARNQLFTGARILVLGNFACFYHQLLEFAKHPLGPLFTRDVEKVDRQDDRAAARLFSAESLHFHVTHYANQVGLSTYLFVMGELIDAWQNRNIHHVDRARMIMRARYFLMAWRSHIIAHPDHATNTHFISRESFDIFVTLCDSLLSLIVVYRKFYPNFPLLPWLHSTEPCEHFFGILRTIKKDFNYSDVLYLHPKLQILVLGAFGDLSAEEQANETAAGYRHTYFHVSDLDLDTLTIWPSDGDLQQASVSAFKEADQLLAAVGINASSMLAEYTAPTPSKKPLMTATSLQRPQTLYELMMLYANMPLTSQVEDQVETCEMAIAADNVDKTMAMYVLLRFNPLHRLTGLYSVALPDSTDDSLAIVKGNIMKSMAPSSPVSIVICFNCLDKV
jgi:hypothetical protein